LSGARRCIMAGAMSVLIAHGIAAQRGAADEGALEFLLPVGARFVAIGQSGVASVRGPEALWWNPAGIVRANREIQITNVTNQLGALSDLSFGAVYSLPRVMSFGLGLRYVNYGVFEARDTQGTITGSFTNTAYVLGATFAASFGNRLSAGMTPKLLVVNFNCTGTCPNNPQNNPITGAVDAGVQYALKRDSSITIGAAVRNLGFALQFNDSPQSDVLPQRVDVGIDVAPKLPQFPGLGVRGSAAMVVRIGGEAANSGPGFRVGGEVSWLKQYYGRAGYVHAGPGDDSGPTLGAGINAGRWQIDFARFISENGSASGIRPTFISLGYSF
jgi:hypothetical protein